MKAFIESQFGYCPLVWMFHSWGINNKINRIHERVLRITYNNKSSSFQNLFDKANSVTIHHRNIRTLAIEIFKVLHRLSKFPTSFKRSFRGKKLQLQFTSKFSKIWYGISFFFSSKNMGHLTKRNKEF